MWLPRAGGRGNGGYEGTGGREIYGVSNHCVRFSQADE